MAKRKLTFQKVGKKANPRRKKANSLLNSIGWVSVRAPGYGKSRNTRYKRKVEKGVYLYVKAGR